MIVAGTSHPFLFSDGALTDLYDLGGSGGGSGQDINELGQVTGYASTADGSYRAFVYSAGYMTDIGALGGTTSWGD